MDTDSPSPASPPDEAPPERASPKRRRPYKIRGPETWALVREAYLAGAPACVAAERYDVTEDAIRQRALREGWSKKRRAQIERPPPSARPLFGPGSDQPHRPPSNVDYAALQAEAGDASARAMHQGRIDEALAWSRLAANYGRIIETNARARRLLPRPPMFLQRTP